MRSSASAASLLQMFKTGGEKAGSGWVCFGGEAAQAPRKDRWALFSVSGYRATCCCFYCVSAEGGVPVLKPPLQCCPSSGPRWGGRPDGPPSGWAPGKRVGAQRLRLLWWLCLCWTGNRSSGRPNDSVTHSTGIQLGHVQGFRPHSPKQEVCNLQQPPVGQAGFPPRASCSSDSGMWTKDSGVCTHPALQGQLPAPLQGQLLGPPPHCCPLPSWQEVPGAHWLQPPPPFWGGGWHPGGSPPSLVSQQVRWRLQALDRSGSLVTCRA